MLNCSNIMYCFEISGTLFDDVPYDKENYVIRNIHLLESEKAYNPNSCGIRWNIVTRHPYADLPLIKIKCFANGMSPVDIICKNKIFNSIKCQDNAMFKLNYFKSVLDEKIPVKYTHNKINRIVNVCNDQAENQLINANRENYPVISINVIDFKRGFFDRVI